MGSRHAPPGASCLAFETWVRATDAPLTRHHPLQSPQRYSHAYTAASDTDPNLTTLLDAAQREPVFIERDQQDIAVLVSARDYDRLRSKSTREFLDLCDKMAEEAAANGLTEAKLQEILDHV